jgi:hypothetical protein
LGTTQTQRRRVGAQGCRAEGERAFSPSGTVACDDAVASFDTIAWHDTFALDGHQPSGDDESLDDTEPRDNWRGRAFNNGQPSGRGRH